MLRRREHSSKAGNSLPTSRSSPVAKLPSVIRNHSVATSKPSFHERLGAARSYFSPSSAAASRFQSPTSGPNKKIWIYYIPALILFVSPWIFPHNINREITKYRMQIQEFQAEQRNVVQKIESVTKSVRQTNSKIHSLHKENDSRMKELRENGGSYTTLTVGTRQYEKVEQTEEALVRRLDLLEQHIQRTSAKLAVQAFGDQPHRVQVTITDMRDLVSSFVIELAPLSEMPHAVYHFLRMVDLNIWDGLSFVLGEGAVRSTSAAAVDYWVAKPMKIGLHDDYHSWENYRFESANLTHLAFTEHSTNYPGQGQYKYSVAFSGHPGGPSFYIRMDDAEESVIDVHQQPSTFGKVVEGMNVLDRYWRVSDHRTPVQNRQKHVETLTIQRMELLR